MQQKGKEPDRRTLMARLGTKMKVMVPATRHLAGSYTQGHDKEGPQGRLLCLASHYICLALNFTAGRHYRVIT